MKRTSSLYQLQSIVWEIRDFFRRENLAKLLFIRPVAKELAGNGYLEGRLQVNHATLISRMYLSGDMINYLILPENEADVAMKNNTDLNLISSADVWKVQAMLADKITTLKQAINLVFGIAYLLFFAVSYGTPYSFINTEDLLSLVHWAPSQHVITPSNLAAILNALIGTSAFALFLRFKTFLLRPASKLVFSIVKL